MQVLVPAPLLEYCEHGYVRDAVMLCVAQCDETVWAWLLQRVGADCVGVVLREDAVLYGMQIRCLWGMLKGFSLARSYALVAEVALKVSSDPDTHLYRNLAVSRLALTAVQLSAEHKAVRSLRRLQDTSGTVRSLRAVLKHSLQEGRLPPLTGEVGRDVSFLAQCVAILVTSEGCYEEAVFLMCCCCALGDVSPHPMEAILTALQPSEDGESLMDEHALFEFLQKTFRTSEVATARQLRDGQCIVARLNGELHFLRVVSGPMFDLQPYDPICLMTSTDASRKVQFCSRSDFFDALDMPDEDYKYAVVESQKYGTLDTKEGITRFSWMQDGEHYNFRCPSRLIVPAYPSYVALFAHCFWNKYSPDSLPSLTERQATWVSDNGFLRDA